MRDTIRSYLDKWATAPTFVSLKPAQRHTPESV